MKSIASAPGKIILFGEHFVVYGIKAILCSIDKRVTAKAELLDEAKIRIKSELGNIEFDTNSLTDLDVISIKSLKPFFYIAKNALEENRKRGGIEISIKSDIPVGIGLGSSSASCVAVAASVERLFKKFSKEEILSKAIEAERTIFEDASGADSSVSTYGGLMLYDIENGFEKINLEHDLNFVIANSNQIHNTKEVVRSVREFKERNEELFANLSEQESGIIRNVLLALKNNDLSKLGSLMSKNQDLLRQIRISTEKIESLINEAEKTSYGAKITGAGKGGCIISLVDKSNSGRTLANLSRISECFLAKIDFDGLRYL